MKKKIRLLLIKLLQYFMSVDFKQKEELLLKQMAEDLKPMLEAEYNKFLTKQIEELTKRK